MPTTNELQSLLDKQAITELIHSYCQASDRHDHEKLRTLYHEDAIDDHGSFYKGLAMSFIDKLPEIQAPMKILHHNATTINIALDTSTAECTYAEAEVYVLAYHQVAIEDSSGQTPTLGVANDTMDLLIGGRYFDKFEKRAGVWKFSYKAVVADWATVDTPSRVALDHPMLTGSYFGCPGKTDPSFSVFKLIKFGP